MSLIVRGALTALVVLVSSQAFAQTSSSQQQPPTPVRAPGSSITVTATKEPADPASLPVSVTAIPEDLIKAAGITFISDAGILSPNTHFTDFTARKLSNPRIRGIGAGPSNPGVVTYVDGVPQFNANTSSFDLIDVNQIEFVRGPQSALFRRNALGGLINITSARPAMNSWGGNVSVPFGTDNMFDLRASVSGPVQTNKLAAGFSMAFSRRDGYSTNIVTGNDIDSREAFSGKGQLLWIPNAQWQARVIVGGERARDGDYALNDLSFVRSNPFEVARDFEGSTSRDLFTTTVLARRESGKIVFSSTTGIVRWKTIDETDFDYSPFPLATRLNEEDATQFTQEVRFASAVGSPVKLNDRIGLRWQAGAFFFTQDFSQDAANTIAPFVLNPGIGFTVVQTRPRATLDDSGIGVYGQGTFALSNRLDVSVGARVDHENRKADLLSALEPAAVFGPPVTVNEDRSFTDVSPQVAAAFRFRPGVLLFGSVSRAFKAGGFNPVSVPGSESYGEEHAWHVEGGVKATAANGRYSAAASVFAIDWDALQLNVPIPFVAGDFYIANIGGASSRGVEFEATARPYAGVDVFGVFGFTRARFASGTTSEGVDVSDNKIPNTPAYTATFGAQYSREITGAAAGRIFIRGEIASFGEFEYNEANTQRQEAYTIANLRGGWKGRRLTVEGWIRNAFDTKYIPLAFAFPFAQSGFLAEPGRPRTAGISVGIGF